MSSNHRMDLESAFILHRRPYRDTSLLLEIFTRDHGRVGLVARGASSKNSRLRGVLEPFSPVLISWQGRGELGTLTGAELAGSVRLLQGAILFNGLYLNELLMRLLTRFDPHPELFDAYTETLSALAHSGHERALRLFEKRLLEELGYGLMLDQDAESGAPVVETEQYDFELERGPVRACESDRPVMRFPGRSLLSLHRATLGDADSLRDAKRLMRAALSVYLGSKPLQTRKILESMARV